MLEFAQKILKALAGAATAGLAAYGTAMADQAVTGEEWITIAVAAVGAGLVVWAVPNKPPAGT